jgi:hypothetical protein
MVAPELNVTSCNHTSRIPRPCKVHRATSWDARRWRINLRWIVLADKHTGVPNSKKVSKSDPRSASPVIVEEPQSIPFRTPEPQSIPFRTPKKLFRFVNRSNKHASRHFISSFTHYVIHSHIFTIAKQKSTYTFDSSTNDNDTVNFKAWLIVIWAVAGGNQIDDLLK